MVISRVAHSAIPLAAITLCGLYSTARAAPDAVLLWSGNAGTAAVKACMNADVLSDPFHESRMYAMMHIAIHDALNAINPKYQSYAYDKKADPLGIARVGHPRRGSCRK